MKNIIFLGVLFCSPLVSILMSAQPQWWVDYSLVDVNTRQDDALATIGQAKHAVQKGYQYLESELSSDGGAGTEVTNLYNTFCTIAPVDPQNDMKGVTLGQLKYLGKPFYDRINSLVVGLDTSGMNPLSSDVYPWTSAQVDDADLAIATIGQLKFVFSFNLAGVPSSGDDTDGDGIPDDWELLRYGDLRQGVYADFDRDGISDYYEFLLGFDPLLPDVLVLSQHSDSDGVVDNEDAAPFDDTVGRVNVSIALPLDGSTIQ